MTQDRPPPVDVTLPGPAIATLVASARDGDVAAFCELYRAFAPRVYRFCRSRVAQSSDAEDLTQQTFLRVVEALPRYEDRGLPFGAWLFRIARNQVIDLDRRRRDYVDLDELARRGDEPTAGNRPDDAGDDRDTLLRAMARLTRDQRDVLGYRFFADLSARETGRLMGRDEATVRGLQARAIAALRRTLDADTLGRKRVANAAPIVTAAVRG
jgi:RNA polymerase sigma-70 factor (ECF subfamily)